MAYLLDTDTCIYLIREKPARVVERIQSLKPTDIGVSSITLAELIYGVEKSAKKKQNSVQNVAPKTISPEPRAKTVITPSRYKN